MAGTIRHLSTYHHEHPSHEPTANSLITEINVQLALFRDLLIHIGQPPDCPELRERVRRLRRACVEATKQTSQLVLPTCKKILAFEKGYPIDNRSVHLSPMNNQDADEKGMKDDWWGVYVRLKNI
ncbi:hypothetical protein RR48_10266 [Papilio machaon]|uniref:Uncharacterized protein n=1 Tax=Papilio machaon TaxID=76193 RepID=A0A194RGF4_PAPMA|nr:hypothetical protein RR48_10266 [Papilio machaon]